MIQLIVANGFTAVGLAFGIRMTSAATGDRSTRMALLVGFAGVADPFGNDAHPAQCLRTEAGEADRHQHRIPVRIVSRDVAGDRPLVMPALIEGGRRWPARMATSAKSRESAAQSWDP
jgi:hypothetical protein